MFKKILFVTICSLFISSISPLISVLANENIGITHSETTPTTIVQELLLFTDQFVLIENDRLVISNKEEIINFIDSNLDAINQEMGMIQTSESVFEKMIVLIDRSNDLIENDTFILTADKQLIDTTNMHNLTRSSTMTGYWWGVRGIFYSDASARNYAYKVRLIAHGSAASSLIFGVLFGGIGALPSGLTAVYANVVADSVDHNANKPGNGVILDLNYLLFFTCKPRI